MTSCSNNSFTPSHFLKLLQFKILTFFSDIQLNVQVFFCRMWSQGTSGSVVKEPELIEHQQL